MKRILSFLLALVLVFTLVPFQANASTGGKLIALTFDDGPDAADTPRLLEGLRERGVKVTFFVLGENSKKNLSIVEQAYADGHEIGCHSWNHPDLTGLSASEVKQQFSKSYDVLDQVCGDGADYLVRPPYGSTNSTVRAAIGSPLIHWSVDPEDWKYRNANTVYQNIVSEAHDGAIVLAHDIHSTTVDGVLKAIDKLLAQGYEFVTVSELFRRRGVELEDGTRYYQCKNNGTDLGPIPTPEITYTTDKVTMTVTITANTDAPIYYTTDGSYPNEDSTRYTGPFTVEYGTDIKAVAAYRLNGSRSEVASLEFGKTPCEAPEISVAEGVLTLSCDSPEAEIYYTLDGSTANLASTLYTGPVELESGCYIHAIAGGGYYKKSQETVRYCSDTWNLYADVKPDDWFFEAIDRVVAAGMMNGMGSHKFAPRSQLTRGQLVTLLYRYDGQGLGDSWTKTNTFQDVGTSAYYSEAVEWAYRNGIVDGYSEKEFRPNGNITRQELCKIIDYFLTYRGNALPEGASCEDLFGDYEKIASWALPSVEAMVGAGLIQGDTHHNMNPKGTATRAEVATILTRVMDYEESLIPEPEPEPTEPSEEATEPTETATDPTDPPEETTEPTEETTEPTEETTEPTEETTEPTEETTEPTEETAEPTEETTEPTEETTEPAEETTESTEAHE